MRRHYIREWRVHRQMSQAQLAVAIGITRPYFTMIEGGRRTYNQTFLEAAAKVLRCTPGDLLDRPPASESDTGLDHLSDGERAAIVAAVKTLISG